MTYVLTGGVIAAFLGPTSATYTVNIFKEKYVASFIAMAVIGVLNQIAVRFQQAFTWLHKLEMLKYLLFSHQVSLVTFPSTEELRTSLCATVSKRGVNRPHPCQY